MNTDEQVSRLDRENEQEEIEEYIFFHLPDITFFSPHFLDEIKKNNLLAYYNMFLFSH